MPGGVTQVKEVTAALVRQAKSRGIATVLVGHVTKDGAHRRARGCSSTSSTSCCSSRASGHSRLRMVRAIKNRFGPVDEVGCFDLSDDGIIEVTDPSGLFSPGTTSRCPAPASR